MNKDIILIILLLVLIGVILYAIVQVKSEGFKAMKNPFTYSIDKMSEYYKKDLECYCGDGISVNRTNMIRKIEIYNPGINWKID